VFICFNVDFMDDFKVEINIAELFSKWLDMMSKCCCNSIKLCWMLSTCVEMMSKWAEICCRNVVKR
jgi:hypothetical protein